MNDLKIRVTIDGMELEVEEGLTVLEAAKLVNIHIPTLCYLKGISKTSSCRICLVEWNNKLVTSCSLKVQEGMNINTNTDNVRTARKTMLELLLSNHHHSCAICHKSNHCELQQLTTDLNVRNVSYDGVKSVCSIDSSSPSITRDLEKCILCGRCINTCSQVQTVHAIDYTKRGFHTKITTAFDQYLAESVCVNCGQCILACPVGALYEKEQMEDVWKAIADPEKFVVVQTAPAVRVALGEAFGLPIGTRVTGRMVAALRKLGFDKVFDTDFSADLTVMEEGTELVHRLQSGENLPLMTSCCPGWVKFIEHQYPEMIHHLSTCKSPHEMEGALIKSYFAKRLGLDPNKMVVVSIMPCVAKKYESQRGELSTHGLQDVDYVLTTRELAQMIKEAGIDFIHLDKEEFDHPFGDGSGAAVIFGATGGVTEAALRTVYEILGKAELKEIEFLEVRGLDGLKEARITLPDGKIIKTAIVNGLGNARILLDMIKAGTRQYDFIEVMACPGGCINGGGQPFVRPAIKESIHITLERAKAIYQEDRSTELRKSHKNPYIKQIYEEFLEHPNSKISHEYLHTRYRKRKKV